MMARRRLLDPNTPAPQPATTSPARAAAQPPIAQVAGDAAAQAALREMSDLVATAKQEGRLIEALPLNEIDESYLIRDRMAQDEEALRALVESLRDRGQQTPIEVVELSDPTGVHRYGLIAGWRRLNALRRLRQETGDDAFATVKAVVRPPQPLAESYIAMVEENEIRVGLSYFERARIVLRAIDQGVFPNARVALKDLFGHASRARRSKIRAFVDVVEVLDGALSFPTDLGERLGLDLARHLSVDKGWGASLAVYLRGAAPATAEAEQALIASALAEREAEMAHDGAPAAAGPQARAAHDASAAADRPGPSGPDTSPPAAPAPDTDTPRAGSATRDPAAPIPPADPPVPAPPRLQAPPPVGDRSEPRAPKTAIQARPGVYLEGMVDEDGSRWIVLSGPAVDDDLAAALRAWLAHDLDAGSGGMTS